MNNKIGLAVIVVLAAVAGFFVVQNMELKKKLQEQDNAAVNVAPPAEQVKPANPEGVSPFEKPNVDPNASQFSRPVNVDSLPTTTIKFDRMMYDFGRINEGDVVETRFKFVNTGDRVLLITHAQASCGCTVPTTPKDPIKPGESNVIDVVFNSAGKKGETTKTITVQANTKPFETVLVIKATVIPKDK